METRDSTTPVDNDASQETSANDITAHLGAQIDQAEIARLEANFAAPAYGEQDWMAPLRIQGVIENGETPVENARSSTEPKFEDKGIGGLARKAFTWMSIGGLTAAEKISSSDSSVDRYAADANDSRSRKIGKSVMRGLREHWPTIVPAVAVAGIFGYGAMKAFAGNRGIEMADIKAAPSVDSSPVTLPWNNVTGLPPLEAVQPPAGNVNIPAPTPGHILGPIDKPTPNYIPTHTHNQLPTIAHIKAHIQDAAPGHNGKQVVVLTGGATDPDAEFIKQQLIDNGTLDPNKVTIIQNHYPAEMAPFVGTHTTQESTAIGAQGLRDIIAQNPNANITSYEFSEGNFPADTVAAELYKAGNHNVKFIGYGSGNSASGLLNSKEAQMFRPIVDGLGITQTPPAPGSTMILSGRDMYASTAGDGIGGLLQKAIGPDHRIVAPGEQRVMTFTLNGVNYEVVDQPVPLPPGAVLTSGIPAPGFGGNPQALIPGVNLPPDPNLPPIDSNQPAPNFVPNMDQLPPAPRDVVPPVHLDAPAQFGDAPCVAPNGDPYFTGVGQPC